MAKQFNKKRGPRVEKKEFEEEVVQIDRVTRVVKGGRRLRFRATVVIGDRKGRVGVGVGKSTEVQGAIKKAVAKAKVNLIKVNIYRDTVPHRIQRKFKSAIVLLMPAGEGTGIIAGGAVRKVVELAGIKNILSKSIGSNNKLNCTKATYNALKELRFREDPKAKKEEHGEAKANPPKKGKGTKKQEDKKPKSKESTKKQEAPKKKAAPKKKEEKKSEDKK